MTAAATLFTRDDTLLGVCEGLGEEFGFDANYLRVVLAALLLWNAWAVVGAYLAVGTALAIGRLLWPARDSASSSALPLPVTSHSGAMLPMAEMA